MSTIVNLYGGPGAGKSTSAAYIFSLLKQTGVNAELVREYAKDWAWEGRKFSVYDQIYLLGKQSRRESMLYGKVDVIVTDCPVMLSVYYANKYSTPAVALGVTEMTRAFYRQAADDGHNHLHVLLKRTKAYNPAGRYQTEEQAREIDVELEKLLNKNSVPLVTCGTASSSLEHLVHEHIIGCECNCKENKT